MSVKTTAPTSIVDFRKFANEAGISLVGKIFGRILSILADVILARFLGPSIFGLYAIGSTLLRFVSIISPLGLQNGVIWFGSQYWKSDIPILRGIIVKVLAISSISGLLTGLIFFALSPQISSLYDLLELVDVIEFFSIIFPLVVILRVAAASTRITQKLIYSYSEDILQPLLNFILIVILLFLGLNLFFSLFALWISFAIALSTTLLSIKKLFFNSNITHSNYSISATSVLKYSLPTAFTGALGTATLWIDRLILGYYFPSDYVGIYQIASQSSMLFVIILYGMNSIFAPMIADLYHMEKYERLMELYKVSTKWGLYLGLPAFIVIITYPTFILNTVLGPEYVEGARAMVILNIGQIINLATGAVAFLLIMTGNQNIWFLITALAFICSLSLNFILIPRIGINGAAFATSLSVSSMYLLGLFYIRRSLKLWPYDRRYIKVLIAFLINFVAFLLLSNEFSINSFPSLIIVSISSYISFFIILIIFGLDYEDKQIIQLIQEKVPNNKNR